MMNLFLSKLLYKINISYLLLICWLLLYGRRGCYLWLKIRLLVLIVWRFILLSIMKLLFVICCKLCCIIIRLLRRAKLCWFKLSIIAIRRLLRKLPNLCRKESNQDKIVRPKNKNWPNNKKSRRKYKKY